MPLTCRFDPRRPEMPLFIKLGSGGNIRGWDEEEELDGNPRRAGHD